MKTFSDWSSLEKHLKEKIDDVLKKNVLEAVRDEEQIAIAETVYAAYGNKQTNEPNWYKRRYDEDGGLRNRFSGRWMGEISEFVHKMMV